MNLGKLKINRFKLFFVVIVAFIFFSSSKPKNEYKISSIDSLKTEYYIDSKPVSEQEFKKFLSFLTEIEGTWYCVEMVQGGGSGYNVKDKEGVIYYYLAVSEDNRGRVTLTREIPLVE